MTLALTHGIEINRREGSIDLRADLELVFFGAVLERKLPEFFGQTDALIDIFGGDKVKGDFDARLRKSQVVDFPDQSDDKSTR